MVQLPRPVINGFIIFHLVAVPIWLWTPPALAHAAWVQATRGYVQYMGLEQFWNLFAPDVATSNFYLEAIATFGDGTTTHWTFPRAATATPLEALFVDRWRKWEMWVADKGETARDATVFVARQLDAARRHPVRVQIVEHVQDIPPPGHSNPLPEQVVPIMDRAFPVVPR